MKIGDQVAVVYKSGPIGTGKIIGFPLPGKTRVRMDSVYLDGQIEIEAPNGCFSSNSSGGWTLTI